jgi:GNAT superfamily N-acetyltransferase
MGERSPNLRHRIPEILRWRGLFIFGRLAVRELLRPVVYWHVFYIFERDVRQPLPEPYSKEKKQEIGVTVYRRDMEPDKKNVRNNDDDDRDNDNRNNNNNKDKNLDHARTVVAAMGELAPEEIDIRLNRGDAIAIASSAGEPVGYGWLSFSSGVVELAFGVTWILHSHEAVRYGNFVPPDWRGRGIQSFVNTAVNAYARDLGITRTLASISTLNTQSMSLAKHYRTARTMKMVLIRIHGLNRTIQRTSGAPFESRFAKPV